MDDFLFILSGFLLVISGFIFISAQAFLCISMPQEWFTGLVSGILFAFSLTYWGKKLWHN